VQAYFDKSASWEEECVKVAASLHKFGILLVRDPRVKPEVNEEYIDMVENYFEEVGEKFYRGETLKDCHPELSYQTGVTPESIEKARDHTLLVESIPESEKPMSPFPPEFDAKWRFFWPIGERPAEVRDEITKTTPENFPDWEQKMDTWGNHMVDGCEIACEMAAIGLGLPKDIFTDRMRLGPHLLSPTASDLVKNDVGTAFAGFHYDLNFLTCHGKSRYPGLFIWLRNWKKMACKIPPGCLLMQSGIMFEHLTGGFFLAGYHEVIYT
jgi:isopenicillin N synthase-like dioxygenase